ncbi:GTPase-associated protein 1-related protein [Streptomyces odontomachi]|uniref:GTPase-associated protein 1-related protein n=1 Tax=Streptomyces odontomachi TaxID=2944940 RepID=UPI00210ECC0A|nr:GTPase-associated protein 1-related protein [Streptomyces sp. ODS25]
MVIRRLSYRLAPESATGDLRLQPDPGTGSESDPGDLPFDWMERAITLTHRGMVHDGAPERRRGRWARRGARERTAALSCSRLPGGGTLLCAARTQDTSPEVGIEAVYLSAGAAERQHFWPIDTWCSPAWEHFEANRAKRAERADRADEDAADAAADLPGPGGRFTHELLAEFAREHAPRVAPFLADVRRLFANPAGRQIVLIEDEPETVAHWIALACAALPEEHGRALTFTTRTMDPHRAPQQILGIGPDTPFDRGPDQAHRYRVHDGTGGPDSPPLPDPWADVVARLWVAGRRPAYPPSAAAAPGVDAFAPDRLAPQLLEVASAGALADLSGEALRGTVAVLADAARQVELDSERFDELVTTCQEMAEPGQPGVIEPLALALARVWLTAAQRHGPDVRRPDLLDELPLTGEARRVLRGEVAVSAEAELRRRLPGPFAAWAGPLHLVLTLGGGTGHAVADAVARLSWALLHPGERDCADAAALLERLAHPGLTRRVLERLAADGSGRNVHALRRFAASPEGRRLTADLDFDTAPLTVRLALAAARWAADPEGPRGAGLFVRLVEAFPDGPLADPRTLETVCALVWQDGRPARADLPEVIRVCPPRRFVAAGLGRLVADLLADPMVRVDLELLDYAREMLRYQAWLTPQQRNTAELLVLVRDLEQGRVPVVATLERINNLVWMMTDARHMRCEGPLWEGVVALLAIGLARTPPTDLSTRPVPAFLAAFHSDVARSYGSAVLQEYPAGPGTDLLATRPESVAALFCVWHYDSADAKDEWRRTSRRLLTEVLGRAVLRMDHRGLAEVARHLRRRGDHPPGTWEHWLRSLGPQ